MIKYARLLAIVLVSSNANAGTYSQGILNILCECKTMNHEKYTWHHIITITRDDFNIDLNLVCERVRIKYDTANSLCLANRGFKGTEYAYDKL